MRRYARFAGAVLLAIAMVVPAGCSGEPEEPKLEPKVAPPAIGTAGVLKAGVDLDTPPFAGEDAGQQAGLDIDVAAAIAEQLGLRVQYVDVKPSEAATALADGSVDVVLSVPLNDAGLTAMSLAGSYVLDGPALFIATDSTASVEPSLTIDTLLPLKVGAQEGSESFWALKSEFGVEWIKPYASLKEGIEALEKGEIDAMAGDALVGGYIIRDFPNVHLAGQLAPAMPLTAAVTADNAELGDSIRAAMDQLAADGVFEALRGKWVGGLPELQGAEEETETP